MAIVETIEVELKGKGVQKLINDLNKVADACKKVNQESVKSAKATKNANSKATSSAKQSAKETTKAAKEVAKANKQAAATYKGQAKEMMKNLKPLDLLKMKYEGSVQNLVKMLATGKTNANTLATQTEKCQKLGVALSDMKKAVAKTPKALKTEASQMIQTSKQMDLLKMRYQGATAKLVDMLKYGKSTPEQLAQQIEKCQKLALSMQKLEEQQRNVTEAEKKLKEEQRIAAEKLQEEQRIAAENEKKLKEEQARRTEVSSRQAQQMIRNASELDLLKAKYEGAVSSLTQMISSGNASSEQIARQTEKCQKLAKAIEDYEKNTKKASRVSDTFKKTLAGIGNSVKGVLRSIGRIAFYRLIRSAIKAITDAAREGLENAYKFSQAIDGSLARSLDKLASANQKLKNQFGAAWGAFIEWITPALLKIIEVLTVVTEYLTKFFSLLAGKSTYLKASDVTKKWADDTERGAEAANEWKNQLLGFDEINKLEYNKNNDYDENDDDPLKNYTTGTLEPLGDLAKKYLEDFANYCVHMFDKIKNGVLQTAEALETVLAPALQRLFNLATQLETAMSGALQRALEAIKNGLQGAAEKAEEMVAITIARLTEIGTVVVSSFETAFSTVASKMNEIGTVIISSLESAFSRASEIVRSWCESTRESLASVFDNIPVVIGEAMDTANVKATEMKEKTQSTLQRVAQAYESWCADVTNAIYEFCVGVADGFNNALNSVGEFASAGWQIISEWASSVGETIAEVFNSMLEKILSALQKAWDAVSSFASSLGSKIQNKWNSSTIQTTTMDGVKTIDYTKSVAASIFNFFGSSLGRLAITAFASGGTPASGSLFIAGESGAELVSTAGGSTSVSNTDQIASSVSNGNVNVVNAIYSMANAIVSAVDSKDMNTYLDGKEISYGIHKYNNTVSKNYGRNFVTIT